MLGQIDIRLIAGTGLLFIVLVILVGVLLTQLQPLKLDVQTKPKYMAGETFDINVLITNTSSYTIIDNIQIEYSSTINLKCGGIISIAPNSTFKDTCSKRDYLTSGKYSVTIIIRSPNIPTLSKTVDFEVS